MHEVVYIPGAENKTRAKLKRILAEFMLVVSGCIGAFSRNCIFSSQQVKQRSFFQFGRSIGFHFRIDKKRERDARLFAENARVSQVTEADRSQICAARLDFLLVFAQLRDVLAAEHSAVVAQKNDHRRTIRPQRAKSHGPLACIGIDGCVRQNCRR
jgi:hypothetical protein